jgi:hypothetical protein
MGAIVTGGALPGCRMARPWHLMRIARVRLPMQGRGAVLSAVWTLQGGWSHTGHANDAKYQHHNVSDLPQSRSETTIRPPPHRGSIANP